MVIVLCFRGNLFLAREPDKVFLLEPFLQTVQQALVWRIGNYALYFTDRLGFEVINDRTAIQAVVNNIGCDNCNASVLKRANNRAISCGWLPNAFRKILTLNMQKASSRLGWTEICIKPAAGVMMTA